MEFIIVMIVFFIVSYIVSVASKAKDLGLTNQWKERSKDSNNPVYWDYSKESYVDSATGLSVQEYYWKDNEGEYYHYWVTKPDVFGNQKFVRARYFKKSKWNDPVKDIPDWILNPRK